MIYSAVYGVLAFRTAYRETLVKSMLKMSAVAVAYLLLFFIIIVAISAAQRQ